MKKFLSISLVCLLLSTIFLSCYSVSGEENDLEIVNAKSYGDGYRYNAQGWIYVHIEGEPYERGYQHGYLLSAEIVDMIQRWSNVIHNAPLIGALSGKPSTARYEKVSERWWNFLKSRAVRMYWEHYPEEYKEEIKGIANGVAARGGKIFGENITYEDILTSNEIYEIMQQIEKAPFRGVHPLKTLFHLLRQDLSELEEHDESSFISSILSQPPTHHCSGFIATGDATTDGQIVSSQSTFFGGWWFSYYIAQRWNVVLDIQPSRGHRVIMSTAPGYIWSDENFYQNDDGIMIIDTTYAVQGQWMRDGLPFIVRTRTAAQYSKSIDDVIYHLRYRNNGIWPAVWLIGDTKTGEIARFELGLDEYGLWRTKDGFYWSANNIMHPATRSEQLRLKAITKGRLYQLFHIVLGTSGYEYYTREYRPTDRDIKFEELGKENYGNIDSDVVKKIMSTPPNGDFASDTKITDSYLLKNNGLWVYWGNPQGTIWNSTDLGLNSVFSDISDNVEPAGWSLLYGLPEDHNFKLIEDKKIDEENETDTIWKYKIENSSNSDCLNFEIANDVVYVFTNSGKTYGLSRINGAELWIEDIGENPGIPVAYDNTIFVKTNDGLKALIKSGDVKWSKKIEVDDSKPQIVDDYVIVGTKSGDICAFDVENGDEKWNTSLNENSMIYLSTSEHDKICACTDKKCYLLNAENGEIIWSFQTDGPITSPPRISDGVVYVGSWDTNLYALDQETGDILWKYKTGWGIDNTPAVDDDMVFFGSMDNSFYALDKETGEVEWVFNCMAAIHSSPAVYGEYVFFGCDDGRFYALNKTTGESAWIFTPGYSLQGDVHNYITTPILSDPIIDDGKVLFSAKGTVYVLDTQTDEILKKTTTDDTEIPVETWLFIIIALLLIVFVTIIYLFISKRRNN